ncbi:MAG TPA: lipoyl synthase [bacterium]|nr:lipoyl synthase [bacterium]
MRLGLKPGWLNRRIDFKETAGTASVLGPLGLNTVCNRARCPNISECFSKKTATFLILGHICTRGCGFCNIEKGEPGEEPKGGAEAVLGAVKKLGIRHAVITSVTRDDLDDGGAGAFKEVIKKIKGHDDKIAVEVLVPDFMGSAAAVNTVLSAGPDILGHNLEVVKRLYAVRRGADYERTLFVLKTAALSGVKTKSSIMLGLGETTGELLEAFGDLRSAGCSFLSLGQYLRPAFKNTPVERYVEPAEFEELKKRAYEAGFEHVESGPYVRSSYNAAAYLEAKG